MEDQVTLKKITERDGYDTFPPSQCSLCNEMFTNHYCTFPLATGLHVFEHGGSIQKRCGRAVCVTCREKHNYESRIFCPDHYQHPQSQEQIPTSVEVMNSETNENCTDETNIQRNLQLDLGSPSLSQHSVRDNSTPAEPTSRSNSSRAKRKAALQQNKAKRIRIGIRCAVKRHNLYGLLHDRKHLQDYLDNKHGNGFNYFGEVVDKVQGKWIVKMDVFPIGDEDDNNLVTLSRTHILIIDDQVEKALKETNDDLMNDEIESTLNNTKKLKPKEEAIENFIAQGPDVISKATKYKHVEETDGRQYTVEYTILGDNEHIEEDQFIFSSPPELNFDGMDLTNPETLKNVFFDRIFADVTGHAKIMDKFLADERCSIHRTARDRKITFHHPNAEDPDWEVKLCYMLMISATTERFVGAENLWKKGKAQFSRHYYPDYGKYVSLETFKCFKAAAPYAFCDEKEWFRDARDKSWKVFTPALDSYNERRLAFFKESALAFLLDESMAGWRPKTSKRGGLPHISLNSRRSKSLS